jgi:hypothetical protein
MIFELSLGNYFKAGGRTRFILTDPSTNRRAQNPAFNVIMQKRGGGILREKDFANSAILYMMTYIYFYIT